MKIRTGLMLVVVGIIIAMMTVWVKNMSSENVGIIKKKFSPKIFTEKQPN